MSQYKLTYFNSRGKAEVIRLLFAEAAVPFEDVRLDRADWPNLKPKMPFGQIPVLEIDGKTTLPQSKAIAKYLAKQFNLQGKNDIECAFCDAYVEGIEDTMQHMRHWRMEKDPAKKDELWKKFQEEHLKPHLDRYEKFLTDNGNAFFVGTDLTWADLFIFNSLQNLTSRHGDALQNHPKLQNFINGIANRPKIKSWLNSRPVTEM